jgi:tetratricopeptide (TPR) repeat protein
MSHINEALKKAQKEKDARALKYSEITAAIPKREKAFARKIALVPLFGVVLALLGFVLYSRVYVPSYEVAAKPDTEPQRPTLPPPAIRENPAKGIYDEARQFHDMGRLKEAGKLYEETLKTDPGHVEALNNLGVILLQRRDYDGAQENFLKVIRLRPDSADPHYNLACLYALRGELDLGMAHLKRAVSLEGSAKAWAKKDKDLENLRKLPEFEAIVGEAEVLQGMARTPD